jgi:hypothetical protein
MMHKCKNCGFLKDESEFYKRNNSPRTNMCKSCKREYNKKHYSDNKELYIKRSKDWHNENKEQHNLNNRKNYKKNKESYKARAKNRHYKLMKQDQLYKLSQNIRSLIRQSFKYSNNKKSTKTSNVLGCSTEYFKEWLGGIPKKELHMDHIIPSSWATTEKEVIALNHYSNFRLVDYIENISKGNRYSSRENIRVVIDNHNDLDTIYNILIKNEDKLIW